LLSGLGVISSFWQENVKKTIKLKKTLFKNLIILIFLLVIDKYKYNKSIKEKKMNKFTRGEEVLITTYNPPMKVTVADTYELPLTQVPIDDKNLINKYLGKNVPLVEVFIDGKVRAFISDVVKKIN